ncbi:mucin-5AC [Nematostella vectensis]|uniref:mucin-5AC n=1 Tax=Nematostella vectensis TaxID=45351 RepID=UPI0020775433|nr:mucin-5AC [Nematostella vectensis]XP_048590125.1 mucin-5AC [Nematostella vectensis]XP_048590126.1 mucin-5AC [Nematostella vectensis]
MDRKSPKKRNCTSDNPQGGNATKRARDVYIDSDNDDDDDLLVSVWGNKASSNTPEKTCSSGRGTSSMKTPALTSKLGSPGSSKVSSICTLPGGSYSLPVDSVGAVKPGTSFATRSSNDANSSGYSLSSSYADNFKTLREMFPTTAVGTIKSYLDFYSYNANCVEVITNMLLDGNENGITCTSTFTNGDDSNAQKQSRERCVEDSSSKITSTNVPNSGIKCPSSTATPVVGIQIKRGKYKLVQSAMRKCTDKTSAAIDIAKPYTARSTPQNKSQSSQNLSLQNDNGPFKRENSCPKGKNAPMKTTSIRSHPTMNPTTQRQNYPCKSNTCSTFPGAKNKRRKELLNMVQQMSASLSSLPSVSRTKDDSVVNSTAASCTSRASKQAIQVLQQSKKSAVSSGRNQRSGNHSYPSTSGLQVSNEANGSAVQGANIHTSFTQAFVTPTATATTPPTTTTTSDRSAPSSTPSNSRPQDSDKALAFESDVEALCKVFPDIDEDLIRRMLTEFESDPRRVAQELATNVHCLKKTNSKKTKVTWFWEHNAKLVAFSEIENNVLEKKFKRPKRGYVKVKFPGTPFKCHVDLVHMTMHDHRGVCVELVRIPDVEDDTADKTPVSHARNVVPREAQTYPDYWQAQGDKAELIIVRPGSAEFIHVESLLKKTLPAANVTNIERVQNKWLYRKYAVQRALILEKNGVSRVNEMELFHGTRKNDPKVIWSNEDGFDMRYSADGMWGRGAYFAVDAAYCHQGYVYVKKRSNRQAKCQVFLATVLTGDTINMGPNRKIRKPPLNLSTGMNYDSITGVTLNHRIYVLYQLEKAYPAYLITYIT